MSAGFVAGAIVTAAPYVYYWRLEWRPLQDTGVPYYSLLLGPVLAGGLVAALLVATPRRRWPAVVLSFVLGLASGVAAAGFYFSKGGDVPQEWWLQALLSLCFAALGAVVAAAGGMLGWACARIITGSPSRRGKRRLEPWQAGAVLVAAAVVVFGALAALAGR